MATMNVAHERLLHRPNTIKENRVILLELSTRNELANKNTREISKLFARLNAENARDLTRGMTTYEPAWHNKKVTDRLYGPIPERPSGSWWGIRMDCSRDRMHDPFSASVQGGPVGAVSMCTTHSKEDVDFGDCFTFTGQHYVEDGATDSNREQVLGSNSLLLSFKNQVPVRVVRGYSLSNEYSPKTGYRYDGLYMVVACWIGISQAASTSAKCYKFALKRLRPQEPPPWDGSIAELSPSVQSALVPRHSSVGTLSPKEQPACDTIVVRCPSREQTGAIDGEFSTSVSVNETQKKMHEVEPESGSGKASDNALTSASSPKIQSKLNRVVHENARVTRCSAKKFSKSLENVQRATASWSTLPNNKTDQSPTKKRETSPGLQKALASRNLPKPAQRVAKLNSAHADKWNGTEITGDEKWERLSAPGIMLEAESLHPKKSLPRPRSPVVKRASNRVKSVEPNLKASHGFEHSYARPCAVQQNSESAQTAGKKEANDFENSKVQAKKNSVATVENGKSVRRTRSSRKTSESAEKDSTPGREQTVAEQSSPMFRGFVREEISQPQDLRSAENLETEDTSISKARSSVVKKSEKVNLTVVKNTNARKETKNGKKVAVTGVRLSIRSLRTNVRGAATRTRNEKKVVIVKRDSQTDRRKGVKKRGEDTKRVSFRAGNGSVKSKLRPAMIGRLTRSKREQGKRETASLPVVALKESKASKHCHVSKERIFERAQKKRDVPEPTPATTHVPNFKMSYNNPERFMINKAARNAQQNSKVLKALPPESKAKQRQMKKRRKSKTGVRHLTKISGGRNELKLRSDKSERRRRMIERGSNRLSRPNAEIANLAIDMNMSPKTQMHRPARLGRGQRKRTSEIATRHPSCPQKRARTVRTAESSKAIEKKNAATNCVRGDSTKTSMEKAAVRGTKFGVLGSRSVKLDRTAATQHGSLPPSETYARRRRAAQLKKQQEQDPRYHHLPSDELKLALNRKKLEYTLYRGVELRKPKMTDVSTQCSLLRTASSSSSSSSSFDRSCEPSPIRANESNPRNPLRHNPRDGAENRECSCRSLRASDSQPLKTEVIDLADVKSEIFEDDRTFFDEVMFDDSDMLDADNTDDRQSDAQPLPAGPSYPLLLSGNRDWDPMRSAWSQQASTSARANQKKEESGDCGSPRVKGFVRYVSRRPSAFVPVNSVEGALRSAQLKSIGFKPIRPGLLSSASSSSDPRCRSTSDSPRIAYASAVVRRAVNEEYERYTSEENSVVRYMDAELRYQDIEEEDNFQVEYNEAASDEITIDKMEFTKVGAEDRSVDEAASPVEPEDSKQWHSELGEASLASDNTEQEVTEQEMLRRYTVPPLEEDPAVPWHGWRKIIANEQTYWVGW